MSRSMRQHRRSLMLGRSRRFRALLGRSEKSIEEGKGLSEREFWSEVRKRAWEKRAEGARRRMSLRPLAIG